LKLEGKARGIIKERSRGISRADQVPAIQISLDREVNGPHVRVGVCIIIQRRILGS
jgi:hypothetical protein